MTHMDTSSSHTTRSDSVAESQAATIPDPVPKRSIQGSYTATFQPNLFPDPVIAPSVYSRGLGLNVEEVDEEKEAKNVVTLPPVDQGFGAWSYVVSAFSMFVMIWGFPEAFPVFQLYLTEGESARHPESSVIALLSPGMLDVIEGVLFPILPRSATHRRKLVVIGILIVITSLLLASNAKTKWQIVLTQGLMFGVGGVVLNFVHVSICSEWFDRKRGQAMGIIWLGYRLGNLGFPVVCQWLLTKHGYEQTMLVLVAPFVAMLLPCIFTFRGRYPASKVKVEPIKPDLAYLRALCEPRVLYFLFVTTLFNLVANIPPVFLMRFGMDLQLKSSELPLLLALDAVSAMLGVYIFGALTDRGYHKQLMSASAILTAIVHITWGFVKTKYGLYAYAISIGLVSGGYDNSTYGVFSEEAGSDGTHYVFLHGMFSFFRGLACMSAGPIGVQLLRLAPEVLLEDYALGRYKYLVAYASGLTMASGMLSSLWILNQHNPERSQRNNPATEHLQDN